MASSSLFAGDAVDSGVFTVEPPTLICLGFEWAISGDDNRNATVSVEYREVGQPTWLNALPLLRIGGENIGISDSAPLYGPRP